jgi:hypothetical protein
MHRRERQEASPGGQTMQQLALLALRRMKKILGASRRGSLTFCNNFAVCSFSAKT